MYWLIITGITFCSFFKKVLCKTWPLLVATVNQFRSSVDGWRNDTLNLHNQYTINWYTGKHIVCIFFKHICCNTMHFNKGNMIHIFLVNKGMRLTVHLSSKTVVYLFTPTWILFIYTLHITEKYGPAICRCFSVNLWNDGLIRSW